MAQLLHRLDVFSDGTVEEQGAIRRPPLWVIREDKELFGYIRTCAPCPAVVILKDDPHAVFNKQWQYFYRAINYNVPVRYIPANYGNTAMLFNKTGFPGRHDYISGVDVTEKDPNADKVRSFVRNVLTGVVVGNNLRVETFDSQLPPPLKEGRSYPQSVNEINIDDYAITPRTHRWMFAVENVVNRAGLVKPVDHGAVYDWTGTSNYYTFFPVVSNHAWWDVLVPLSKLRKIGEAEAIPSPYRFS